MGPRVFISYSHKNVGIVDDWVSRLRSAGFECWQDHRNLHVTDDIDDRIKAAIRRSLAVILFASGHSMCSKWVLEEVKYTLAHRRRVIMVRLDTSEIPAELSAIERLIWIETQDPRQALTRVLKVLRRWRYKILFKRLGLVLLIGVAVSYGWTFAFTRTAPKLEVVVGSDLLPATIWCDGRQIGTLTVEYPRSTIEASGFGNVFEARHGQKVALKLLSIRGGSSNQLLFFSATEFR